MKQTVCIIGTVGIPASYGGFETCAEQLCSNFQKTFPDLDVIVYCSSRHYKKREDFFGGAKLKYVPIFRANGWQSIFYDAISILHAAFILQADKILVMGVSGSWIFPIVKLFGKTKILVNLDGVEWKRKKWGRFSRMTLRVLENLAVGYSNEIIADNMGIKKYVESSYAKNSIFIPYGGDHISVPVNPKEIVFETYGVSKGNYSINISRIEPENNNDLILSAFSELYDHRLIMIGDWDLSEYSRELYNKFSGFENITLLPAMYDRQLDKNILRANAKYYVHGHSVGGTSPALVEALCLGRNAICFDVIYNRETTFNMALYFKNNATLKALVEEGGENNLEINAKVAAQYTWKAVTAKYVEILG